MKKVVLILSIICLCNCTGNNNYKKNANSLIASIAYLEDFNSVYNLDGLENNTFTTLGSPNLSYKNGWYWFKVILKEKSKKENKLFFQVLEPSVNTVSVFNNDTLIATKKSRKGFPNINFNIDNKDKHKTLYLKVHFKKRVHFPLRILTLNQFYKSQEHLNLGNGIYYGMVIMIFILNLIFFFTIKDNTFIYYCLFMSSINFAFTGFDGILYFFYTPNFFDPFFTISHILIQIFGALFAAKFLNLNEFYPRLNKIGLAFIGVPTLFYIAYSTTNNFLYFAIADFLGLLILGYYWFMGVLMLKKEAFAKFFVIGYAMALFAALFYLTPLNFGLSSIAIPFHLLKFGNILEMLVLTYAITYRVKLMREENIFFNDEIKKHIQQIFQLEQKLEQKETPITSTEGKIETIAKERNLTDRESDILYQIINGLNNRQIADKLFISVNTVKYHTKNLYEKLEVKKRTEISSKIIFNK